MFFKVLSKRVQRSQDKKVYWGLARTTKTIQILSKGTEKTSKSLETKLLILIVVNVGKK